MLACGFKLKSEHLIDEEGLHPVDAKVKKIKKAHIPTEPSELKSFLGMLSSYGKFMTNLSSTLEPLHELLRKNTRWKWKSKQQEGFKKAKNRLRSSYVQIPFAPKK